MIFCLSVLPESVKLAKTVVNFCAPLSLCSFMQSEFKFNAFSPNYVSS